MNGATQMIDWKAQRKNLTGIIFLLTTKHTYQTIRYDELF
jgi:hypothetical protein